MARIRTIRPQFWKNPTLSKLSRESRLTYLALHTFADDEGRLGYDLKGLTRQLYPLDLEVDEHALEVDLRALRLADLVVLYAVGGQKYLQITGFVDDQKINRPSPSKLPEHIEE